MIQYMQKLFSYDHWANGEVLVCLQSLTTPSPRSIKWLSHILSAERLWNERLQLKVQTHPVWPEFSLDQCQREIADLQRMWKEYLESLQEADLTQSLSYKNTKGESFNSPKQDILMHVITHGAHHRGQIAADIRASGSAPPYLDFIHAARQGFLQE